MVLEELTIPRVDMKTRVQVWISSRSPFLFMGFQISFGHLEFVLVWTLSRKWRVLVAVYYHFQAGLFESRPVEDFRTRVQG